MLFNDSTVATILWICGIALGKITPSTIYDLWVWRTFDISMDISIESGGKSSVWILSQAKNWYSLIIHIVWIWFKLLSLACNWFHKIPGLTDLPFPLLWVNHYLYSIIHFNRKALNNNAICELVHINNQIKAVWGVFASKMLAFQRLAFQDSDHI